MKVGVVYYPEHWDSEIWEKDADLMVETGVKVVRLAEFAWSRLEPVEGQYNFTWLDKAVDIFAQRGIEVILGTPTNCPPLWLYEKYPDAILCDEHGNRINIGVRGHRCYNSPSLIKKTIQIVTEMAEHYSDNKAVVSWQIDNELEANHCTCPVCADKFRNWLKKKYTTLEKLNDTYGNVMWSGEYSDWSQITPPLGDRQNWLNPAYLLDYYRYASESMIEFVKLQADIIRAYCKSVTITTNMFLGDMTPDFYKTFEDLSYASYDNYPVSVIPEDHEEIYSHAFHLDLTRGIKRKNFCIMEQLSGAPGCWMPIRRTPRPNMIKGYSLQAFARGADCVLHFRWRSATKGAEMFWHGILDHNNKLGRRYEEFRSLCNTVNEELQMLKGTTIRNKVALLFSQEQDNAFKFQQQADGFHYYNQLKLFHDGVTRLGAGIDIVSITANLDQYEVVIAPTVYVTSKEIVDNLTKYVDNGGKLILTNRSGVKDETGACIMEYLPGPFTSYVGAVVEEYDALGNDTNRIRLENGKTYRCSQWADIMQLDTAQSLGTYMEDFYQGKSAVTKNTFGHGEVYYVGTILERDFYRDFMNDVLEGTTVEVFSGLPDGVEVSVREDDSSRYLLIFNNTNHAQEVNLTNFKSSTLYPFDLKVLPLS